MRKYLFLLLSLLLVFALVACSGTERPVAQEEVPTEEAPVEEEEEAPVEEEEEAPVEEEEEAPVEEEEEAPVEEEVMADTFLARAKAGEFSGEEVTIFGKWTEGEEEAFVAALAPFAEATGIDVVYEGSADFETLITVRVEGGDPPDVAGFPQPGLMAQFAADGAIPDHASFLDVDTLKSNYSDAWINLATVNGQLSGVFYRASTKSIVWYPVEAFEAAGYAIPTTWDEMLALSDTIVEEQGVTPWCISILHEGVTGWVATDWLEDILLRTASPEVYDQWVAGELPFNSPEIKNAAEIMGDLWFNEEYVYGGTDGILNIFVGDTQTPMFEDPPECWFHRQAGWIPGFWPEGTEAGVDSSFFYLPPIDPAFGKPVLGGGDVFSAFNDNPATAALMEYLSLPEGAEEWVKAGGFISPNSAVPADWYGNYVDQAQAQILAEASTLRFDASDLMPAEVGAGTFWEGMVDWISGEDLDTVLTTIDESWPEDGVSVDGGGEEAEEEEAEEEEAAEEEEMADVGEFAHLASALAGEYDGTEVTIFGKWTEGEEEAFVNTLASFVEETGINVVYEGSADFETLITVRTEGGDPPDIAGFPQPGLMAQFVGSGDIIDLGASINVDKLKDNYSDAWINLGTVDGQLSGVFFRASTKSIVWYPVEAFEAAGYAIPTTWDEMLALSDTIVEEQGVTPWCISILHEGVTGWVATDWLEDIMLRTASPEAYDQWVAGELPFNSPEVLNAAAIMGDLWFNEEYVYGGTDGILNIFVGDTQTPMFEDPPECWFHRQAGWIPSFWPEGTEAGVDSSFFYLPPIDEAYGKPVLGGGDVFAAFSDRPEVIAVMEYLASPESAQGWLEAGGFISPNRNVPTDWYGSYVDQAQAQILAEATTLRFDASDLMPAEVGAGTFWEAMVDWISGGDIEELMQKVDESWPEE